MTIAPALVGTVLNAGVHLIDKLFVTEADKDAAKLKLLELEFRGELAQLEVNAREATNPNLFVSGWRPGVGWVCLTAFAVNFVGLPVLESLVIYYSAFTGENVDLSGLPDLNMAEMMPVLFGMLGLGGLRSYEKSKGLAS